METEAQRLALAQHGCDELQGFLLGRPLPARRLLHRVQEHAAAQEATAESPSAAQYVAAAC